MIQPAPDAPPPSTGPLERVLRVFGDVRAGEGGTALLMLARIALTVSLSIRDESSLQVKTNSFAR